MTLTETIELFLQAKEAEEKKVKTLEWYYWHLHQFARWAEEQPAAVLSTVLIEQYLTYRRRKGLQPETVAGSYRALNIWFNWMVKRGYLAQSPMAPLSEPKIPDKQPRHVSKQAFDTLLASIRPSSWLDHRDRAIIGTLFFSGIRVSELTRLRIQDIDHTQSVLWLYDRKANEDSFVPILPELCELLQLYLSHRPTLPLDSLFLSSDGWHGADGVLTIAGVRMMLVRRTAVAGMDKVTPHMFRHGLAMHLTAIGADSTLIQLVLGHRDQRSTRRYSRWDTQTVVRRFGKAMEDGAEFLA